MKPNFTPIEYYKTKFYQSESNSKRFEELSEEQLSLIAKKIYKIQERKADTQSQKLDRYQKTLQYLTNPNIYFDIKSFDEKVAYLIMMTDPNLVTFKEFLKLDLISTAEIAKVEDEAKRNKLKKERAQTISAFESKVRETIGFFDIKLIKYEEMFFKRFFNKKELITDVGSNNQNILMSKAKYLKDFNSISDKRFEELIIIAQNWLSLAPNKYNVKVAAYSIINQKELLGLNNLAEQFALFILLIDSNLDILKIYEEESMMKVIENRIIEQFGYFNNELLILEEKFHDRFCPDKKLSVWTRTKKR